MLFSSLKSFNWFEKLGLYLFEKPGRISERYFEFEYNSLLQKVASRGKSGQSMWHVVSHCGHLTDQWLWWLASPTIILTHSPFSTFRVHLCGGLLISRYILQFICFQDLILWEITPNTKATRYFASIQWWCGPLDFFVREFSSEFRFKLEKLPGKLKRKSSWNLPFLLTTHTSF